MSKQPRDDSNYPIPVLGFKPNGGHQLTLSNTSLRSNTFAPHTRVISIFSTGDCFFEIGGSAIEANTSNSHLLPAGVYLDVSLGAETVPTNNAKYIAVISNSTGILYISERG